MVTEIAIRHPLFANQLKQIIHATIAVPRQPPHRFERGDVDIAPIVDLLAHMNRLHFAEDDGIAAHFHDLRQLALLRNRRFGHPRRADNHTRRSRQSCHVKL